MTLSERRARLQKRREAFVVNKVQTVLRELTPEKAREAIAPSFKKRTGKAKITPMFDAAASLTAFGTLRRADFVDDGETWKAYDTLRESSPDEQAAAALLAVGEVWVKRLTMQNNEHATAQAHDAQRICEILGVDYTALQAEAKTAIPQPKSWGSLPENDASPEMLSA